MHDDANEINSLFNMHHHLHFKLENLLHLNNYLHLFFGL